MLFRRWKVREIACFIGFCQSAQKFELLFGATLFFAFCCSVLLRITVLKVHYFSHVLLTSSVCPKGIPIKFSLELFSGKPRRIFSQSGFTPTPKIFFFLFVSSAVVSVIDSLRTKKGGGMDSRSQIDLCRKIEGRGKLKGWLCFFWRVRCRIIEANEATPRFSVHIETALALTRNKQPL